VRKGLAGTPAYSGHLTSDRRMSACPHCSLVPSENLGCGFICLPRFDRLQSRRISDARRQSRRIVAAGSCGAVKLFVVAPRISTDAFRFSAIRSCCELGHGFHCDNTGSNPVGDAKSSKRDY
jgi:hypothetical protein